VLVNYFAGDAGEKMRYDAPGFQHGSNATGLPLRFVFYENCDPLPILGLGLGDPRVTPGSPKGHPSVTQAWPKGRMGITVLFATKVKKRPGGGRESRVIGSSVIGRLRRTAEGGGATWAIKAAQAG